MVNIGGRSRGCSNCRRRCVKCDEHRPSCLRCQRCDLECEGVKDVTFIEGAIVKSRRSKQPAAKSSRLIDGLSNSRDVHTPVLDSPKTDEFEIAICFARKYLSKGAPIDLALQNTLLSDITASGTSISTEQLFLRAFLSFSVIIYGAQHRNKRIIEKGFTMRGVVLRQLNIALSEPKCYARNEVLLSVITLAILDCKVPAGSGHYLRHMMGLQTLLDLRGPRSLGSQKASLLHKTVRQMILFASLRMRKPSILAREEWKRALKATVSGRELEEQILLDVLADCTVVYPPLEKKLRDGHAGYFHERNENRQRALVLLVRLRTWRKEWDKDRKNSYTEYSMPSEWQCPAQKSTEHLAPATALRFSDASASVMFMFYNTALICVSRVLASLPGCSDMDSDVPRAQSRLYVAELSREVPKRTKDEYLAAEQLAALDIYRCLPTYSDYLSSSLEINNTPNVAWAVSTAWDTLGGQLSLYGRRMKELLDYKDQNVVAQGLWSSGENLC